jgi:hypothetical protein
MNEADPLKTLEATRLMRTPAEGETWEHALEQVAQRMDPGDLPALLAAFDDGTEQPERMWGLLHLVEAFDDVEYANAFLGSLREATLGAEGWMETLLVRQLNSDAALAMLLDQASRSDRATQHGLRQLLGRIARRHQPVATRAHAALRELTLE